MLKALLRSATNVALCPTVVRTTKFFNYATSSLTPGILVRDWDGCSLCRPIMALRSATASSNHGGGTISQNQSAGSSNDPRP